MVTDTQIPDWLDVSLLPRHATFVRMVMGRPLFRVPLTLADKLKLANAQSGREKDSIRHARQRAAERAFERHYKQKYGTVVGYSRTPDFIAVD